MNLEQAERFVTAAEEDFHRAVAWYCTIVEEHGEGEGLMQPRADVLAAQQVLLLAREELRVARRREGEAGG